jgi:hypothetical protein
MVLHRGPDYAYLCGSDFLTFFLLHWQEQHLMCYKTLILIAAFSPYQESPYLFLVPDTLKNLVLQIKWFYGCFYHIITRITFVCCKTIILISALFPSQESAYLFLVPCTLLNLVLQMKWFCGCFYSHHYNSECISELRNSTSETEATQNLFFSHMALLLLSEIWWGFWTNSNNCVLQR